MLTHPNPELLLLSYREVDGAAPTLVVDKTISLYERTLRVAEFFTNVIVHPSGKVAVASCYAGKLKVILFKGGRIVEHFDVS